MLQTQEVDLHIVVIQFSFVVEPLFARLAIKREHIPAVVEGVLQMLTVRRRAAGEFALTGIAVICTVSMGVRKEISHLRRGLVGVYAEKVLAIVFRGAGIDVTLDQVYRWRGAIRT